MNLKLKNVKVKKLVSLNPIKYQEIGLLIAIEFYRGYVIDCHLEDLKRNEDEPSYKYFIDWLNTEI
jgi:hypothetical protein